MAKWQKKKLQDFEGGNFGKYQENVGGGDSPNGSSKPSDHGHGVNSDYRKENNDTMQPRTDDGKFTYKSANGKSIDPKYGPSRGKTVNPILTGGQNGVYIDDVEREFANKSGNIWNKLKDKWYNKGGEYILKSQGKNHKEKFSTRVASTPIWETVKEYDVNKGEFKGESKVFDEGKKGARTADEQAAIQKAQQTGEEQAVIEAANGGIKVKPGTVLNNPKVFKPQPNFVNPTQFTPQPTAGQSQGATTTVNTAANTADIENADYQPKYSNEEIKECKEILKDAGISDDEIAAFDNLSPKEKDEYIDKYLLSDEEEETTAEGAEQAETTEGSEPETEEKSEPEAKENEEEESEAVKTVRKLGFTD